MEEKKLSADFAQIKIAFLCRDFGKVNRGVEAHVKELSKRLRKKFSVEIFSGAKADSIEKVIKGKFNLVIPTNGRLQALKMSLGRILGSYKILIVAHAGIGRDEIWNLLTLPDVYVALTDYELNWAKKFVLKSQLVKIPNGINLDTFKPDGSKKDFRLKKPIILSVGALEWYKHHDLAIKAVAKLGRGSLLVSGEGKEQTRLEEIGNTYLGKDRFKIIKTSYSDMPALYRSVDLFTLPSWDREAFGIVYLEAMASGLVVVVPNDLSRREIIGSAGIYADVFDSKKYAEAINQALEKDWESIPREQSEKFSWDKIANQYEKLIINLCR